MGDERLRAACDSACSVFETLPPNDDSPLLKLCWQLARRFVAEHQADDGEAITEEWLRSVGFTDHRLGVGIGKAQGGGSVLYCSLKPVGIEPDWYLDAGHSPMTHVHEPQTRGAVRRLAAALGIDLKPVQVTGGGGG
jgi:hypothetical protein